MNLTLTDWKDIATIVGVIVTVIALIKGVYEYIKQGTQKRAEHFSELRKKFKENEAFREIAVLTINDAPELKDAPNVKGKYYKEKRDYLGLFEEVALAVNSGLIKPEIAHYMFGYYAIKCLNSVNFWTELKKESNYWSVFVKFAEKMQTLEDNFEYDEKKLTF